MGTRFEWKDSAHIVMYCAVEEPWTWQQYQTTMDELLLELQKEQHPVATLVDVTHMGSIARDGNVMQNLKRVAELMPDNIFVSVIVGAPYVVVAFMNVLLQIRPKAKNQALFARTIEEALDLIDKRHKELPAETK